MINCITKIYSAIFDWIFLHFDSIKPFASHLNLNLDVLLNELTVVKPMLKNKSLGTIIDLYQELGPFQEAFPVLVELI